MERRDFLNGIALSIVAGMAPIDLLAKEDKKELFPLDINEYYPPNWLGLRGSNNASYEFAHMLRDGEKFDIKKSNKLDEKYDLVVVGAGISGLSAANFYQERFGKDKKILILDNHDDFGGHARRNEIHLEDGYILGYGGSESFQSPKHLFSKNVLDLLKSLNISVDKLGEDFDKTFYPDLGLSRGVYFDKEIFGEKKIVSGNPSQVVCDDIPKDRLNGKPIKEFLNEFPLNDKDKADLIELFDNPKNYLSDMTKDERDEYLAKTSYKVFLRDKVKLSPIAIKYFEGTTDDFLALGIDATCCSDARMCYLPGFDNMGLEPIDEEDLAEMQDPYIYHFPDGNSSVARLMVKKLIPNVAAGGMSDMNTIVSTKFDYTKLDLNSNIVRLRLNSTVVNVEDSKKGAKVTYMSRADKKMYTIKAKSVVMACYNMMIPYLVPTLPKEQKDALALNVKTSLIHTKVVISNWQSFMKNKIHEFYCPNMPYARVKLDYPVDIGTYKHPRDPNKPICLHMTSSPLVYAKQDGIDFEGMDARTIARVGRAKLYEMSFDEHEKIIRKQLQDMLGDDGFNHEKDIKAIVLNRWGHCYSYTLNTMFDDEYESDKAIKKARKHFGNIHIANSDSDWQAYMHAAIDQAYRAVKEIKS
ncbi:NAD(P)/FAD-dependent oxidoreductase [Aliarcobacter cryaerophilus]|uniref:NAD(P)/FAD-dependent oxidoreductase n=1 Tax=Aliarcobacter cryaerophilus TaxID=28198 RepID=UPI000825BFC9|nr:NAD(P)/FAD-dependent oxidoreductase [Aliarcobacter cryaerophilus]